MLNYRYIDMKKIMLSKWILVIPLFISASISSEDIYSKLIKEVNPAFNTIEPNPSMDTTNLVREKEPIDAMNQAYTFLQLITKNKTQTTTFNPVLWDTIKLFKNAPNNPSLFEVVNNTITPFGAAVLANTLIEPASVNTLEQRQKTMHFLIKNPGIEKEFTHSLQKMSNHSHALFGYFMKTKRDMYIDHTMYYRPDSLSSQWLGLDKLNSSSIAQNLFQATGRAKSVAQAVAIPYLVKYLANKTYQEALDPNTATYKYGSLAVPAFLAGGLFSRSRISQDEKNDIEQILNNPRFIQQKIIPSALKAMEQGMDQQDALQTATQQINNELTENIKNYSDFKNIIPQYEITDEDGKPILDKKGTPKTSRGLDIDYLDTLNGYDKAGAVALGALAAEDIVENGLQTIDNGIKKAIEVVKAPYNNEQHNAGNVAYLQKQLIDISAIFRQIKNINDILVQHKNLKEALPNSHFITALFDKTSPHASDNLRYLVGLLLTNTFTGNASWFSWQGRIIAANKLMRDCKAELVPVFKAIGELDMNLSSLQLHKHSTDSEHPYHFVRYSKTSTPFISAKKLWNPLQPAAGSTHKHVEINTETGSNSTTVTNENELEATAIALLLGSTLGIAPAHNITITPCIDIHFFGRPLVEPLKKYFGTFIEEIKQSSKETGVTAFLLNNVAGSANDLIAQCNTAPNNIELITTAQ